MKIYFELMMRSFLWAMAVLLLACSSTSSMPKEEENTVVLPVYNQAYNENYDADTMADLAKAKGAYILLDPFMMGVSENITSLKKANNQVAGYISAGTAEDWRDDYNDLEPYVSSIVWAEWAGEYYVKETQTGVLEVMKKRIDKMASWGLDWVEYDNMDWVDEETVKKYALSVTREESRNYINALCSYTRSKGMKCMAKNTVEGFESFDGVLYESYDNNKNWWDKNGTKSFLDAKKLVIINHYNEADCDKVYAQYKAYYQSENISFICEDKNLKKYKHYGEK